MTHITLLTKSECGLCDQAKAILDRLACEYPVSVEVVPLDTTRGQALAASSGMAFPPGVLLDGKPFSYGRLSERRLRRALRHGGTYAS